MLVTYRYRQRVTAGTLDKLSRLAWVSVVIAGQRFFVDRFITHVPQLGFHRNTQRMEEIDRLFGQANIFLEIKSGSITHQRVHAVGPGVMDNLHTAPVIPVGNHRHRRLFRHGNHHMRKIFKRGITDKPGAE
ncbi:hypothetical protein D3C81_1680310 [compost metagenome]